MEKSTPLPIPFGAGPETPIGAQQAREARPRDRWDPGPLPSPSARRALPAATPTPATAGIRRALAQSLPHAPPPPPGSPPSATAGPACVSTPCPARAPTRVPSPPVPFPPRALLTELFPPAPAPPFVPASQRSTARHTPPPPPPALRPRLARWVRDRARTEEAVRRREPHGAERGRSEQTPSEGEVGRLTRGSFALYTPPPLRESRKAEKVGH